MIHTTMLINAANNNNSKEDGKFLNEIFYLNFFLRMRIRQNIGSVVR
jgi:hypothetical protein